MCSLAESVRFLNGYGVCDGVRALPAPLSWQQPKGEAHTVYDFAVEEIQDQRKAAAPVSRLSSHRLTGSPGLRPSRQITIHTQRNRDYGRPTKQSGAVYRYDALAAGQTFEAAILCDEAADVKTLAALLSGEVFIGGSRNGGYGRAKLMFDPKTDVKTGLWREIGSAELPVSVNQCLTITLLSEALLRDDNGQYMTDPAVIEHGLRDRLGVPTVTFQAAFVRGRQVGGFNRKTNLPLPQAVAVQSGSVFVFNVSKCEPAQLKTLATTLRELEDRGIGERRAEGFGRVAANWQTRKNWAVVVDTPASAKALADKYPALPITDDTSRKLAKDMTQRLLRARLDEAVIAAASHLKIERAPQSAQLARLRSIIADELMQSAPNLKRLTQVMAQIDKRSAARKQFETARIGTDQERLATWLKEAEPKAADRAKLLSVSAARPIAVGDVQATLTPSLRDEYVLRLIDTVLAQAAKTQHPEVE